MDKLQRAEAKEILKSIFKIDRHNFKQKMMTAVMFYSGLTANGSNLFTPEDFSHLPGLEKTIKVTENLMYGNQLKKDMEQEKFKEQGLAKQPHADNYAHKYVDVQNGEEGLRAAVIAYLFGLGKEAWDVYTKTILSTEAGKEAHKQDITNKQEFEKNSQEKGKIVAAMIFLCNIAKNEHNFRTTILKQLLKNEKILDKDVVLGIANECLKDIGNNGWALKEGVKIAYAHRLENIKKFLSGQPMSDLDIKYEAQEAVRYLDLDSNTMGTKDNQIADAINASELQKANDKKASVQLAQGVLRPRHNIDVAFVAVDEKIKRRRGLYDPNATVASNSEKYNSGDTRIPPQSENNKTTDTLSVLPEGWALLTKEETRG